MIPFLGVLMAALLLMQEESKQRELAKKREQRFFWDYAEVVSKLQVLVGRRNDGAQCLGTYGTGL